MLWNGLFWMLDWVSQPQSQVCTHLPYMFFSLFLLSILVQTCPVASVQSTLLWMSLDNSVLWCDVMQYSYHGLIHCSGDPYGH